MKDNRHYGLRELINSAYKRIRELMPVRQPYENALRTASAEDPGEERVARDTLNQMLMDSMW